MKNLKKSHLILIIVSVLILLGCIGITAFLLLSNYQNVRLFRQAQENFRRNDAASLSLAETQLQQVIARDNDNEAAYIMLGVISEKNQCYPEQVYYCHMAHRLNPLSRENKAAYIRSLCSARYFDRLENFLAQQTELDAYGEQLLLYAACHNNNMGKYKHLYKKRKDDFSIAGLAMCLYGDSDTRVKLENLKKFPVDDPFLKQEVIAGTAGLYLNLNDYANAGKALEAAYELNRFAFAPALGRFYANFNSFGKALPVFEKHLEIYHDPAIAIQTAEIYCLLRQTDKISRLREQYQADAGNSGMLSCYYFDALTALAKNDMANLKELTIPLRKHINTPLAAFMFLCADLQGDDLAAINSSYNALIARRNYLDLQSRADAMVSDYLKRTINKPGQNAEDLLALANTLHKRRAEAFTAKIILLIQKKRNAVSFTMLNDAMKRFSKDQGIVKIAIEYFVNRDFARCGQLINYYKKNFPAQKGDMLHYEIDLALRKREFEQVSQLFQQNFDRNIHAQYWEFASRSEREKDLQFLSRDPEYAPFCRALLLLKKGEKDAACDLLEKADAKNNPSLLFFAAKTLGENGRNRAALNKYSRFPENSPYKLAVLLNTAELYSENGNPELAVILSRKAYNLAPDLPEAQLCYADKLHKNGNVTDIPDVIKLSGTALYRNELEKLYIAGMEARIKVTDAAKSPEKLRQLCETLLRVDSHNQTASAALLKVRKLTRHKMAPEQQNFNRRE